MKHHKNIAVLALLMACFAQQSYAASFEPLGPDRSLGDVYEDLMTADEINQYIGDKNMSYAYLNGTTNHYTYHSLKSSYRVSDIFDVSSMDPLDFGPQGVRYIIMMKGGIEKYSYALLIHKSYNPYILVYHNGFSYINDEQTGFGRYPVNISMNNVAQVPEPSTLLSMALVIFLLGFLKIMRKLNPREE